jgi:zinc transport system permease protein
MLEIFQYDFMIRALIGGIILSILAPIIGIFVVLKRYAMLSDTLAHVSLLGVSIGIILNISPTVSTIIIVLIVTWLIEILRYKYKIYSDSLLAMILSISLALSIILVSLSNSFNSSLLSYLFGSILAITNYDIYMLIVLGIFIIGFIYIYLQDFIYLSLDENVAKISGVKTKILNSVLIITVGLLVALSIHIIGSLLIGSMIVIPVISALQLKLGFVQTLFSAITISVMATLSGLFLSFFYAIPSGASIVAFSILIFILILAFNSIKK